MDTGVNDLIKMTSSSGEGSSMVFCNHHSGNARLHVSQSKLPDFLLQYCRLAYEDSCNEDDPETYSSHQLGFAETINSEGTVPVVGEFRLQFHIVDEEDDGSGIMDEKFIIMVVHCYQLAIAELFHVEASFQEILCVVMESEPEISGDDAYVRLRLHFPYCQTKVDFIRRKLRPRVEQLLRGKNVLRQLRLQPVGDWGTIIQDYSDTFLLYGSTKEKGQNKLRQTHIYSLLESEHIESGTSPELSLDKVFIPGNHSLVMKGLLPLEVLGSVHAEGVDMREFWLPLFLSVNFWQRVAFVREKDADSGAKITSIGSSFGSDVSSSDPKIMANYLIKMLASTRVKEEMFWLDIGRVLYNMTYGSSDGLLLWSQLTDKYASRGRTSKDCERKYENLGGSGLTVKTLAWYARQDSPDAYEEWHRAWMLPKLRSALSCTHADIAAAVFRMFWLDYFYDAANNRWWRFSGHTLKPTDRGIALKKAINTELVGVFERMRHKVSEPSSAGLTEMQVKEREEQIKLIGVLLKKLRTDTFLSSVVSSCQYVGEPDNPSSSFDVVDFQQRIDSEPNRTGYQNCVIECCSDKAYPRPGKPEDFITMVSPIGYRKDFHEKHPIVLEVLDFFGKVFVDPELRHYVFKRMASILKGRNGEKYFDILSGGGDNAKSVYVAMLKAVLGPYAIDFPVSMLTGKGDSKGSASPELAQARGAHAAFVSEPDSGDEMKAGPIKRFTGNDSFFCRMLFSNGGSIQSTFKLFYMCNRIPNIPNADKAVKERLWICPFLTTFCKHTLSAEHPDGYPEDPVEQRKMRRFKADPDFNSKIPELAYGLLWIMVHYYPHYVKEGLTGVPAIVIKVTEQHWRDNDAFVQFITEKVEYAYVMDSATGQPKKDEKTGDEIIDTSRTLSSTAIYPTFSTWWKLYFPGTPVPNLNNMKAELCSPGRLGGQTKHQQWVGVKLKESSVAAADGAALASFGGSKSKKGGPSIPEAVGVPGGGGLAAGLASLGMVESQKFKL